jgi:hypothetical protein
MKLSKTPSPLEPLKQKNNVIDGLYVHALTGQRIHLAQTGSLLSGAHISKGAIITPASASIRGLPPTWAKKPPNPASCSPASSP